MPTIYPSLAIGAARRLEIFRKEAAQTNWVQPMTWRDVRFATLKSHTGFDSGSNDGSTVWYTHDESPLRRVKFADECVRISHTGWFTDTHQDGKARGIVASLPHGRFIAGYRWSDNGETVYFSEIFTDESDAARMADEHARVFAEQSMEDSERFDAAQNLEIDIEDAMQRLRECLVLRHTECMHYVRDEISELLETIRGNRELLRTEYANYI